MRRIPFTVQPESPEAQHKAGRLHPGLTVAYRPPGKHKPITVPIAAGEQDDVTVLRHDQDTIVLSVNSGLDYCGIAVFCKYHDPWIDTEPDYEAFYQGREAYEPALGEKGLDQSEATIAKLLLNERY